MFRLKNTDKPAYASHPGKFVKQELHARGWTQKQFANVIGKSEAELSEITTGKRNITTHWAIIIGTAFELSPQTLLNMQNTYDLHRQPQETIDIEGIIARAKQLSIY